MTNSTIYSIPDFAKCKRDSNMFDMQLLMLCGSKNNFDNTFFILDMYSLFCN